MSMRENDTIKGMPPVAAPLKRLSRPAILPPFRLTPRDVHMIEAVARYRFLSSDQISKLDGGSHIQVLRRLKLLWAHGYLDRPLNQYAQLAAFYDEGNRPLVYGLGRLGARLLAERELAVNDKLDWTQKNSRAAVHYLAHTIETAQAMISFLSAAHTNNVRLVDHHELLPFFPEATRVLKDPFRCRVTVKLPQRMDPITIGVVPDRLFSIFHADTRRNYALELDRGTMDIKSKTLTGKASFRRKLHGYFHCWKQERHTELWGFKSFRILTVAPSEKRMANMMAAQRDVTNGAATALFLYSTPDRLIARGALNDAWINAKGETVALLAD